MVFLSSNSVFAACKIGVGLFVKTHFHNFAIFRTYQPTAEWSMGQRTTLEDEMARHTTPMYRAPEMLDMWANFPIDTAADVWALGCTLFFLCFHQHPFEDSAKLAIVNGNYRMPFGDFTYTMFHDLIKQV